MLSCFSRVQLFVTPWTVAHQAPLSMRFSRQEYWSELPCPTPGDLPNPGIKHRSPTLHVDSLLSEPPEKPKNTGVGSYSFFRGSFRPRNPTGVSCIGGKFFTSWATREALSQLANHLKNWIFKVQFLNCGVGEDSWESLGLQGDPTSPS